MDRMSDRLFDAISRGIRLGRQISQSEAEGLMAEVESLRQQVNLLGASMDSWRNECMNLRQELTQYIDYNGAQRTGRTGGDV